MHQKGFAPILIVLVALGVLTAIAAGWLYVKKVQLTHEQPAQTPTQLNQTSSIPLGGTQSPSVTPTTTTPTQLQAVRASSTQAIGTSNWKTYTDPVDDFSFHYPLGCQLATSTLSDRRVISFLPCASDVSELISILIFHKDPSQSVLSYWQAASGLTIVSSTPMTINGYPALNIEEEIPPQSEGESGPTSDLLLTKDNVLVVVFSPSPLDSLKDGVPVPEAILNSFRF